ncbi:MAG: hypothetical protein AABX03_00100 [Nanoarchaeota archaeon]
MMWTKSLVLIVGITVLLSIGVYAFSLSDIFNGNDKILLSPAVTNCDPGQTIMTISNNGNAHVGLWNAGYPLKVCYPNVFGENYSGNNPHDCSTNSMNRVIKLSDVKNAHAATNLEADPEFNTSVCYGNILCQVSMTECSGDYKLVVSLSTAKNAHVAGNDSYPVKVCCKKNPTPEDFTPTLSIIKPEKSSNFLNWKKFAVNQTVGFEQISAASVDWTVRWSFGDGRVRIMGSCMTENCNTTESYQEQAHYTISAFAKEKVGLNRSSPTDYTDVLVYKEGINVFAIITNPQFNQTIGAGGSVYFNGRDSFVANCTKNVNTIPGNIQYYSVGQGNNILYCYNFAKPPKPGESSGDSSYKFWYEWTFDPGKPYENKINGTWNQDYNQIVEFNRTFVEEGQHFASLKVGYEAV